MFAAAETELAAVERQRSSSRGAAEDVTGKTADTIATGIDSPETIPGTLVAAASTEVADTTGDRSSFQVWRARCLMGHAPEARSRCQVGGRAAWWVSLLKAGAASRYCEGAA